MPVGTLLIIIGIVALIGALIMLRKVKKIKARGIKAEGIVYDFERSNNFNSNVNYPVIRFLTANNDWVTKTAVVEFNTTPSEYKLGQKVQVIYDANNPNEFIIDAKSSRTSLIIMMILGIVLLVAGVILWILRPDIRAH